MATVHAERMTVDVEGDFVVFLIGMRINRIWKPHKWVPVALAMPKMLRELARHPECGCLGFESRGLMVTQYWRSFDDLERYARSRDQAHWPAWVAFNKRMNHSRGDVGIWHETFKVRAGEYEAVYSGMPAVGLGTVGRLVPAKGKRESARSRMSVAGSGPEESTVDPVVTV